MVVPDLKPLKCSNLESCVIYVVKFMGGAVAKRESRGEQK